MFRHLRRGIVFNLQVGTTSSNQTSSRNILEIVGNEQLHQKGNASTTKHNTHYKILFELPLSKTCLKWPFPTNKNIFDSTRIGTWICYFINFPAILCMMTFFLGGHSSIKKKEHVWQFGIQCGHQDAHKVLLRLDDLVWWCETLVVTIQDIWRQPQADGWVDPLPMVGDGHLTWKIGNLYTVIEMLLWLVVEPTQFEQICSSNWVHLLQFSGWK